MTDPGLIPYHCRVCGLPCAGEAALDPAPPAQRESPSYLHPACARAEAARLAGELAVLRRRLEEVQHD